KSLPEDHMADFHHLDDAREIWLAVKVRFGGNDESKKMKKTMMKQAFSEFSVSEEEGLYKGYDSAASTNTKMVYSDQPSYSSSITYTSAPSSSIMEDVIHSFVAENKPTQQLAYEDFKQVDQLEMEELDIKWQMAMLSLRINKECNVKKVDEKARYSAFKISETKEAEQVYGLMAGFESDFVVHAGNAAGSVNPAAAEFSMMGISPKLALEEKVRILTANLENTTNTLKYFEALYDQAKIEKQDWEVKFVESLARFDKWEESSKNLSKLLYRSMSTRTKLGLGFNEYIGSDEKLM
nr:ribonuclease H-like domain-containing protein [Tanacetum cinerariifolium]